MGGVSSKLLLVHNSMGHQSSSHVDLNWSPNSCYSTLKNPSWQLGKQLTYLKIATSKISCCGALFKRCPMGTMRMMAINENDHTCLVLIGSWPRVWLQPDVSSAAEDPTTTVEVTDDFKENVKIVLQLVSHPLSKVGRSFLYTLHMMVWPRCCQIFYGK